MPSERSPFKSPVEPISPPPEPSEDEGLGWRRRVPPPGPKDVFRCPFIAVSALRRHYTYMTSGRKREGISSGHRNHAARPPRSRSRLRPIGAAESLGEIRQLRRVDIGGRDIGAPR